MSCEKCPKKPLVKFDPCKTQIGSLCVVKDSTLCGTTKVEKLQFKDNEENPNGKEWCLRELPTQMLGFSYQGVPDQQLRLTPGGYLLVGGKLVEPVETVTYKSGVFDSSTPSSGLSSLDPNITTSFISITDSTLSSDILGDPSPGFAGQLKRVILREVPGVAPFDLTVTSLLKAGAPPNKVVRLQPFAITNPPGPQTNFISAITLIWDGTNWLVASLSSI